jgi:hypothetical protein
MKKLTLITTGLFSTTLLACGTQCASIAKASEPSLEIARIVPDAASSAHGKFFYVYDTANHKYRVRALEDGKAAPAAPNDNAVAVDYPIKAGASANELAQAIASAVNDIGGVTTGVLSASPVDNDEDGIIEEIQIGPIEAGPTPDIEAGNSGWLAEVLQQGS